MKKLTCLGLSIAMALSLLTGCGGNSGSVSSNSGTGPSDAGLDGSKIQLSGTVLADGSTSMEKVVKVLSEAFMEENKGVTINYNGSGSGAGITAVIEGTADLGLSSRELKAEEVEKGAVANIVALDGVAIVINPANPVSDLTVEQVAQLFTGKISNWKELGGNDAPVAALGREAGSGTRGAFEEIVGVADACVYNAEYSSTGDVIGQVASNPNAIGYASLSAVSNTVKAVKVNAVECTETTVQDGSYEIQRPFLIVTKNEKNLSESAQSFLDFAMSGAAEELITAAGAVPPLK